MVALLVFSGAFFSLYLVMNNWVVTEGVGCGEADMPEPNQGPVSRAIANK